MLSYYLFQVKKQQESSHNNVCKTTPFHSEIRDVGKPNQGARFVI